VDVIAFSGQQAMIRAKMKGLSASGGSSMRVGERVSLENKKRKEEVTITDQGDTECVRNRKVVSLRESI
jgi:hypothetical protein